MFASHPSVALNARFAERPYQGTHPNSAKFLFVGLDANYAADVEHNPVFPYILQYHEDGPRFWRTHGVHHGLPDLLS